MRKRTSIFIALTLLLAAGPVGAQNFTTTLDEAQANAGAGTGSTATGTATMTLNSTLGALSYSITLVGLDLDGLQTPADPSDDVTAFHFHAAPAGVNGPVVFGLISPSHDTDDLVINPAAGTLTGSWENTDVNPLSGQLANLNSGGLYLNVHTTSFPAGEIRGQVLGAPPSVVPTLRQTGLLILIVLSAAVGLFALRRRRHA